MDSADIPSSPPPLPLWDHGLKRPYDEDANPSSDPIFSEDASGSDTSPRRRRKRHYKGPWWGYPRKTMVQRPPTAADSGVWLGSETSEDGAGTLDPPPLPCTTAERRMPGKQTETSISIQAVPEAAQLAAKIVLNCVEKCDPAIDLSDMNLSYLPADAITPLQQMVMARSFDLPDSDSYAPLIPDLRLVLSQNSLRCVPQELWHLTNISVLSLRGNCFEELPSGVGQLKALKELNVASNNIKYLPWELLNLIRARQGQPFRLTIHPNPMWLPVEQAFLSRQGQVDFENLLLCIQEQEMHLASRTASKDQKIWSNMIKSVALALRDIHLAGRSDVPPIFGAASRVHLYDVDDPSDPWLVDSYHQHQSRFPWLADFDAELPSLDEIPGPPSLYELATRQLHRHWTLEAKSLGHKHPVMAHIPDPVRRSLVEPACATQTCSVCETPYVFKRAEWVEYWCCSMGTSRLPSELLFLPFMRRACSVSCVRKVWEERR